MSGVAVASISTMIAFVSRAALPGMRLQARALLGCMRIIRMEALKPLGINPEAGELIIDFAVVKVHQLPELIAAARKASKVTFLSMECSEEMARKVIAAITGSRL